MRLIKGDTGILDYSSYGKHSDLLLQSKVLLGLGDENAREWCTC